MRLQSMEKGDKNVQISDNFDLFVSVLFQCWPMLLNQ